MAGRNRGRVGNGWCVAGLLTDDRLTKTRLSNHYHKAGGVLPVSHLVHYALKRLMKTNRFSQAGQFSKQGDEAELKTPEGRKRLAGLAREFWRKNRGVPLGERFYRYLADDDAAPLRWVEAAAGLVAPADDEGVPDVTYVTLGRPTRAAPGKPRHGDEVKDRVPTVSDLLARRTAELAGNGPASTIPDQGLRAPASSGFCSCRGTTRGTADDQAFQGEERRTLEGPAASERDHFFSEYINLFSSISPTRASRSRPSRPPRRKSHGSSRRRPRSRRWSGDLATTPARGATRSRSSRG